MVLRIAVPHALNEGTLRSGRRSGGAIVTTLPKRMHTDGRRLAELGEGRRRRRRRRRRGSGMVMVWMATQATPAHKWHWDELVTI